MSKRALVIATALIAIMGFRLAGYLYQRSAPGETIAATPLPDGGTTLVRANSPVMGPAEARVTIVEFFDPACGVLPGGEGHHGRAWRQRPAGPALCSAS